MDIAPSQFAARRAAAWNPHDADAVPAHFHDGAAFRPAFARRKPAACRAARRRPVSEVLHFPADAHDPTGARRPARRGQGNATPDLLREVAVAAGTPVAGIALAADATALGDHADARQRQRQA